MNFQKLMSSPAAGLLFPSGRRFPEADPTATYHSPFAATGAANAAPLIVVDPTDRLSNHFLASEFMASHQSESVLRVSPDLLVRLERLRDLIGKPIVVRSGYRTATESHEAEPMADAAHVDGLAADISAPMVPLTDLRRMAEAVFCDGGLGYYPDQGYLHVDVRGSRARWVG